MTLFGIIWFAILLYAFIQSKVKYLVFLTILSSTIQCSNVLVIGNSGIGPQILTSIIFIMKMMMIDKKHRLKISRKAILLQISCFFVLLAVFISSIRNNVLGTQLLRIIQLVIYILCFYYMYSAGRYVDRSFIYKTLRKVTIFLLVVGIIQFLITSGVFPRLNIITELFYNDNLSDAIYFSRDNYYRILSTYMEPSYYSGFIVGSFYYFLSFKEKRKENLFLFIFMVLEIFLTFSSTAYISFVFTGIIFVAITKEKKMKIIIFLIGVLGILFIYTFFYDVLETVILNKMESGSGIARHYWNLAAIRNYNSSPFFGIGYKEGRASSLIYTLLAELGIFGLLTYIFMCFAIIKPIIFNKNKVLSEEFGLRLALVSVIIGQIIAIPDLDICTFWMWMNFLALSFYKYKNIKGV